MRDLVELLRVALREDGARHVENSGQADVESIHHADEQKVVGEDLKRSW